MELICSKISCHFEELRASIENYFVLMWRWTMWRNIAQAGSCRIENYILALYQQTLWQFSWICKTRQVVMGMDIHKQQTSMVATHERKPLGNNRLPRLKEHGEQPRRHTVQFKLWSLTNSCFRKVCNLWVLNWRYQIQIDFTHRTTL